MRRLALFVALVGLALRPVGALIAQAPGPETAPTPGRLFYLDINHGGRVLSANPDGSDVTVVSASRAAGPDGIVVDTAGRHLYWTTMGAVSADDGTVERVDPDGSGGTTVVAAGGTFTPKQIKLDSIHRKLYWSDREGMRIMRANLDGSRVEVLVETGRGDAARRDAQLVRHRARCRARPDVLDAEGSGATAAFSGRSEVPGRRGGSSLGSTCCSMVCLSRLIWTSICPPA
jgi:hypothetical protein